MQHQVLILDFGSQYTQLIARRVRELNIFCEIFPYNSKNFNVEDYKAVILSGSPFPATIGWVESVPIVHFRVKQAPQRAGGQKRF